MFFIILILFVLCLLYKYGTRNHNYWSKKGVVQGRPLPFVGNALNIFLQKINFSQELMNVYRAHTTEKFVGFYVANEAVLILRDLELIKQVLINDFNYFYDRGLHVKEDAIEPLFQHLLFADGDLWKFLRQSLLPVFRPKKLQDIFPIIAEQTEILQKIADKATECEEVDMKDIIARYTLDIVGQCGFGINMNTLENHNSVFREITKKLFVTSYRDMLVRVLKIIAPTLFQKLHFYDSQTETELLNLIRNVMEQRSINSGDGDDFIDLLLQLKKKKKFMGQSITRKEADGSPRHVEIEIDDVLLASQAFMFLVAGFETSSSVTSFTLHQLAFNPDVQRKCQQEIDEVLGKHNNKITYEAVNEMKYLNMTLSEAMRLWPPIGFLIRKCTRKYTFPGTKVTIGNNVRILVPVQALHMDEKYFKDPEVFRPERFHPSEANNINMKAYLPFGTGYRTCIGERLGRMQSIAGIAALLSNFSVEPSKSSNRHPAVDGSCVIVQGVKNGLPMKLKRRINLN